MTKAIPSVTAMSDNIGWAISGLSMNLSIIQPRSSENRITAMNPAQRGRPACTSIP